jgi:4-hydroxy-tetrahydrodipicolinate reductase
MLKIALIGYGKAGQAVANVLQAEPDLELSWIARRTNQSAFFDSGSDEVPIIGLDQIDISDWLDKHPVDALIDFSGPEAVHLYGEEVRRRRLMLVTAISAYSDADLVYIKSLGEDARVMSSPNITLGINFLILAARLLREIAPHADIAILEEHFRDKPEVSGTARKIAESLDLEDSNITSLRLGGIVGHHEVVFGFPYQTVRLSHDSIRREAFGTGAAFALRELAARTEPGYFSFEDLLMQRMRTQWLQA